MTCGHISNAVHMSEILVKELLKFLLLGVTDHVCDLNLLLLNLIFIGLHKTAMQQGVTEGKRLLR